MVDNWPLLTMSRGPFDFINGNLSNFDDKASRAATTFAHTSDDVDVVSFILVYNYTEGMK